MRRAFLAFAAALCLPAFGQQFGKWRQLVIAFDQRRSRPDARDQALIQRPESGSDRRIVRIHQQGLAQQRVWRVAGQVNLPHRTGGKRVDVRPC